MRLGLAPVGRTLARRAVRQMIGRCALAAVGAAFAAVSIAGDAPSMSGPGQRQRS